MDKESEKGNIVPLVNIVQPFIIMNEFESAVVNYLVRPPSSFCALFNAHGNRTIYCIGVFGCRTRFFSADG